MGKEHVIDLTPENFQKEVIESDKPVLVDVWAPWCGPCRQLIPIVEKLGEDFEGKATIGKLNMDESADICAEHRVSTLPAVIIFHKGEVVERVLGVGSEAAFAKTLNRLLES